MKVSPRSLANLKPFPKGVSGNPSGRPKERSWKADIRRLTQRELGKDDQQRIVEKVISMAKLGNLKAVDTLVGILGENAPTKHRVEGELSLGDIMRASLAAEEAAAAEKGKK